MKLYIYIIIMLSLFFLSCSSSHYLSIRKNIEINKIFTQEEVLDFIAILEFFDNEVCKTNRLNNRNIQECYKSFFQKMSNNYSENVIDIDITLEKQLELHKKLKNTIQEDIWFESRRTLRRMRLGKKNEIRTYPDTFNTFILISDSKYAKYLELFSKENKKVEFYYNQLKLGHGISPIAFTDVIENYRSYDIKDDRIRLLVAIHFLTINHQNKLTEISQKKLDKMLGEKH